MGKNNQLLSNTIATYSRSLMSAIMALFASRWILSSLGDVDFGIFSLVGSIVVFLTFINSVMANSVSRFYASAIGRNDTIELREWFITSLVVHFVLAAILICSSMLIGGYLIERVMNIPQDRIATSMKVFRFFLASILISTFSVPFLAMFTAQQRISELAFWGMLQSFCNFVVALLLKEIRGDRLLIYSLGINMLSIVFVAIQIIRAIAIYPVCKIKKINWPKKNRLKVLFSYSAWSIFGSLGAVARDQGTAIVINLNYGSTVNASYGIANQLASQANQLSFALINAIAPEIYASEGRGERERTIKMTHLTSKITTILVLLFAIPLVIEMKYILSIWLKTPPLFASVLCNYILLSIFIDRLSCGYMLAVSATGRIAYYQVTLGVLLLATLPLAFLLSSHGNPPPFVGIAFVLTTFLTSVGRVLWGRKLLNITIMEWLKKVIIPVFQATAFAVVAAEILHTLLSDSILRVVLVFLVSSITLIISIVVFGLDSNDKEFILLRIRSIVRTKTPKKDG